VRAVVVVVALAVAGCPVDECEKKTNLLDNTKWTAVDPANDPFAADPSQLVPPGEDGHFPPDTPHNDAVCRMPRDIYSEKLDTDISLTIDTNVCGWATLEEELTTAVHEGDSIFARIFYFQQIAPGISEAHMAATIDGQPFFAKTIPLPTPSDLIHDTFPSPLSAEPGAKVLWHLDNHGINTWNLLELSITTPIACPSS
jgi:hypothetical protein